MKKNLSQKSLVKKEKLDKLKCPLCGFKFNPEENPACSSCPFQKKCQVVCCPNCGYQTVAKAEFTDFLSRLFPLRKEKKNGRT